MDLGKILYLKSTVGENAEKKIETQKQNEVKFTDSERKERFDAVLNKLSDNQNDIPVQGTAKEPNEKKHEGLTNDEKAKVKEAHPDWPDKIIDAIGSWKEYEIYDKANLKIEYINDKPCLVRTDIDMEQKDVMGRSNKKRMEQGLAPLSKNAKPIELHHIGQHADSPLAELTFEEHHCNGNDTILHDKNKESEVHGEGNNWQQEKESHWETRSKDI